MSRSAAGQAPSLPQRNWGRRHDDLIDPHLAGRLNRRLMSLLIVERLLLCGAGLALTALAPDGPAWPQAALVGLCTLLLILAVQLRLRDQAPPGENLLLLHLLADIALLTSVLHHAGGLNNPFVVFYMLPLSLAAYALAWQRLAACVGLTALMLLVLGLMEEQHTALSARLHETGELLAFAMLAVFVYVLARLSRRHERRVARAREDALNELSSRALGSVAARAADALGSPLSTMSVLVSELRQGRLSDAERDEALDTLAAQIAQCKSRLSDLLASVGQTRGQEGEARDVRALVQSAVHECELTDLSLQVDVDQPTRPAPQVVAERSLLDALVLLIRHCGAAAPHRVHIDIRWNGTWVTIGLQGHESAPARRASEDAPDTATPDDGPIALAATLIGRFNGSLSRHCQDSECFLQVILPAMPPRPASAGAGA